MKIRVNYFQGETASTAENICRVEFTVTCYDSETLQCHVAVSLDISRVKRSTLNGL